MIRVAWVCCCFPLCLAGCVVPADRSPDDARPAPADAAALDEVAFRAAQAYDRELSRAFRALAARAESGAPDVQLAREQEAALAESRRAFAPVARAFDERVKPGGQFNNAAAAAAYREIAAGYERAGR